MPGVCAFQSSAARWKPKHLRGAAAGGSSVKRHYKRNALPSERMRSRIRQPTLEAAMLVSQEEIRVPSLEG
eukprot:CAMPEP_0176079524 /NCGR_PEP_ID=MMETSP0120_2-20121206/39775_1 /TAXON_ID=160619 /ORGANISM="Kryptoperidinium foliaceum, Strain CCMP 1326" /LENGTH=70 /DNA_ID=CAMNT_0017413283 /DNA_START=113 /DNA_END=322 /DNA_ORIENTATION=+